MSATIMDWLESHRVDVSTLAPDEIVGAGHALAELRSIAGRLRHQEVVAAAGGSLPRGLLLHGRPGVGKTTAARWLARAIGADLPVYELAADELTGTRVRELFRALAGVRAVVVIDELDAVALRRDRLEGTQAAVLRALLGAMDGLAAAPGPFVVAATTRDPYELDPALLRAGRIGIHIGLDAPDEAERRMLLELFGRDRLAEPIDWDPIVEATDDWTPAELRAVFDDALGLALVEDRTVIAERDLLAAVGRNGEILPPVPPPPLPSEREAIHEAGHTCAAVALLGPTAVRSITFDVDGGETRLESAEPLSTLTPREARAQAAIGLAGMAAEEALLGEASLAGAADVAKVTRQLVVLLSAGVDRSLPPVAWGVLADPPAIFSDRLGHALVREAEVARSQAAAVVAANRGAIARFAAVLVAGGGLEGERLAAAIAGAGFRAGQNDLADIPEPARCAPAGAVE